MSSKKITRLPVKDTQHDVESFIPLGIAEGDDPGPTLVVVAGVHASEYATRAGAVRFWESLDPAHLSGRVLVVLAADVTAIQAHSMYFNPVDGKNLNRVYPGKADGTLTEVIAHTLLTEVVAGADAVIDCHGGEFDEHMGLYMIVAVRGEPDLDRRTLALAEALGFPFIEVVQAQGEWLGFKTLQGSAVLNGVPAMGIEAGDRGKLDEGAINAVYNALQNAAKHMGILPGEPVHWAGRPAWLEDGLIVRAQQGGVFAPAVAVGQWVEAGQVFGRVYDFDDTLLEEIKAEATGVVLTVISSPAVAPNGFAGKIGVNPRDSYNKGA